MWYWYLFIFVDTQCSNSYLKKGKKKEKENAKYKLAIKILWVIENSSVKKVTLSLSLKWQLAYILPVFPSTPHACNGEQKVLSSNSYLLQKKWNQTSSQKPYFSLHKINSKKSTLKHTYKSLLTLCWIITVLDKIIKNRKNDKQIRSLG